MTARPPVSDDLAALWGPAVPDGRILQALRELGLWGWYESLPNGLDTRLAPGGSDLSAGQAQLLAFARAFLRDPGLIILDEASSRLDPATERQLDHALIQLLKERLREIAFVAKEFGSLGIAVKTKLGSTSLPMFSMT